MVINSNTLLFQVLCFGKEYDSGAQTKQNLLCNGNSPLEVIMASHDNFDKQQPEEIAKNFTSKIRDPASFQMDGQRGLFRPPSFTYVITDRTRYVLVLDRSDQMNTNNRWKNLHNALHR